MKRYFQFQRQTAQFEGNTFISLNRMSGYHYRSPLLVTKSSGEDKGLKKCKIDDASQGRSVNARDHFKKIFSFLASKKKLVLTYINLSIGTMAIKSLT